MLVNSFSQSGKLMTDCCSAPGLLPFEQALTSMLTLIKSIDEIEAIQLEGALDRVLGQDIISPVNVPPCNNSAMDGYAFAQSSIEGKTSLTLVGRSMAGSPYTGKCNSGECVRIMTGAQIPSDCDSVEMQENCSAEGDNIQLQQSVKHGNHVRYAGEDIELNQVVFKQGRLLSAADLGVLASLGIDKINVFRRLNVAVLSTGDELKLASEPLSSGDIYESNSCFIGSILRRLNVNVINLGIIPDDLQSIEQAFIKADEVADAVISSGGVSVGDADFTKEVLDKLGDIAFWKIAMKPGKPFAFGKLANSYFFGLPGNPVSALVTAHQLMIPALLKMQSVSYKKPLLLKARVLGRLKKSPGRLDFQRGVISTNAGGELEVSSTGSQGSGVLTSIASANCYIVLSAEQGSVASGDYVNVQLFDKYLQ